VPRVQLEDLVTVREIAGRFGVGVQAVHQWRRRDPRFPKPLAVHSCALVFSWRAMQRRARQTGRLA
jgi:hypothetical protein